MKQVILFSSSILHTTLFQHINFHFSIYLFITIFLLFNSWEHNIVQFLLFKLQFVTRHIEQNVTWFEINLFKETCIHEKFNCPRDNENISGSKMEPCDIP